VDNYKRVNFPTHKNNFLEFSTRPTRQHLQEKNLDPIWSDPRVDPTCGHLWVNLEIMIWISPGAYRQELMERCLYFHSLPFPPLPFLLPPVPYPFPSLFFFSLPLRSRVP